MSSFQMSGAESEIEDEQIDVDSDPIDTEDHRCQHQHQQQQQHRHGNQLQQPSCMKLHLPYADRPRFKLSPEPADRIRKRSDDRVIVQSALHSDHVTCSTTTELQSLLSRASDAHHISSSSDNRLICSPPSSIIDRSPSSSSPSSSSISSPPSSPPHQKHHRPSTVPSLDTPSPPRLTKSSENAFPRPHRPSRPPSSAGGAITPRSAPAPVTNFFIEEILKASFGVSPKSAHSPIGLRTSAVPGDHRLQGVSPDPLMRNGLPISRPQLPSQTNYEHFPISGVTSDQEAAEASNRNHVTRKRNQSKPSANSDSSWIHHKADLERNDRKSQPSAKVIGNGNSRNNGVEAFRGQIPSSGHPASPLVVQEESRAFKLVTSSNASSANDCSNSNSSGSNASSQSSGSLPEDNRKSDEADRRLHLSDPSSASSGSSNCFQSQQLPAWVYCTRYSDRPSSGPRSRKVRPRADTTTTIDDKRPRTAFTNDQLQILKREFSANQYLNEERRHALATKLSLNETQIKIWFQNKRAKLKKASGTRNRLALELMAQGLYNHSTVTANGECV